MGMLLCFGFSWPVSVVKSIRTRSSKGKSLVFTLAIFIGYICGIIHKLLYSRDVVLIFYCFNLMMVGTDLVLYFVNRERDRLAAVAG